MNPKFVLKYSTLLIVFMFLTSAIVSCSNYKNSSVLVFGDILYVGGSGEGNYTNITSALLNASDGDTIYIYTGLYDEGHLEINKSITFIGENKNTTILNRSSLHLLAPEISISSFTVVGGGLYIGNQSNTSGKNKIFNNIFKSSSDIIFGYSSDNSIENNTFFNSGIYLPIPVLAEKSYDISNKIYNNYANNKPLIYYEDTSDKIINEAGQIILLRCTNITIENCIFPNISPFSHISRSTNLLIKNNTFIDNMFLLHETSNSLIESNVFNFNGSILFLLQNCTNNILKQNLFNSSFSLVILNSSTNKILQNNFLQKPDFFFLNFIIDSKNTWDGNYWYRPRFLPKLIIGMRLESRLFRRGGWTIDIDWHPALQPNDTPYPLPQKLINYPKEYNDIDNFTLINDYFKNNTIGT